MSDKKKEILKALINKEWSVSDLVNVIEFSRMSMNDLINSWRS